MRGLRGAVGLAVLTATAAGAGALPTGAAQSPAAPSPVETLKATGGLPAHMAGAFADAVGFSQTASGVYLVLDRRSHTVYAIDARKTAARKLLQVGLEPGRVLSPSVLALGDGNRFAVADAPAASERIQFFTVDGLQVGAFNLFSRHGARFWIGPVLVNGVGAMTYTGLTLVVSRPETGALFTEYDMAGGVLRHVGTLRPTGQEADRELHLALNAGLPLVDPDGGFYFVFQTGRPLVRKYDASGALVFERHIEGVELDAQIQSLPTTWPRREADEGRLPLVLPLVRAAAVDPAGRLWISLMTPFTYVYDGRGDKVKTVQFDGAGVFSPDSLFFTKDGRILVTPGCYEFKR